MFAYLRDVFEWFSFVRTPNIPTNIEVLSRVKKERKKFSILVKIRINVEKLESDKDYFTRIN